MIYSPDS